MVKVDSCHLLESRGYSVSVQRRRYKTVAHQWPGRKRQSGIGSSDEAATENHQINEPNDAKDTVERPISLLSLGREQADDQPDNVGVNSDRKT